MKYSDVCEAKTKAEMVKRFDTLLAEVAKQHGGTTESHRARQRSNVGYFAGYYDEKTAARVLKWLSAVHPVFGTAIAQGKVTPRKAFNAGRRAA